MDEMMTVGQEEWMAASGGREVLPLWSVVWPRYVKDVCRKALTGSGWALIKAALTLTSTHVAVLPLARTPNRSWRPPVPPTGKACTAWKCRLITPHCRVPKILAFLVVFDRRAQCQRDKSCIRMTRANTGPLSPIRSTWLQVKLSSWTRCPRIAWSLGLLGISWTPT